MDLPLRHIVAELDGDLRRAMIAIREYTEPRFIRIIAPCIADLEDGIRRLESLEERLETITESQLRAELVTIVRNLLQTFDQIKRTRRVEPSWYEGKRGAGIPPALSKARRLLGL
jgi:hypothetical protein